MRELQRALTRVHSIVTPTINDASHSFEKVSSLNQRCGHNATSGVVP